MILKGAEEYDSILHVGADVEFIERFFIVNIGDLDKAKLQLLELYAKEHADNLQKSDINAEKGLAGVLNNRNLALIEIAYSAVRVRQIERASGELLSNQDVIDRGELNCAIAEGNLKVEEATLTLLRVANNLHSGIIWGKDRNILSYQQEYEKRIANKTEDGKLPHIEQLKLDLEIEQIKLNDVYAYVNEQTATPQNNLNGGMNR